MANSSATMTVSGALQAAAEHHGAGRLDDAERLYDAVPPDTWIVVTSDHGELFGEDGYFGHGPIMHRKVFEVPFVEGIRP